MQNRECIVFERTRDTDQRITSRVRVCESRAHPVFNQSSCGSLPFYAMSVAFARWNFLLNAAKKNNNAAKFFVFWKQNNSEGFIGVP